MSRLMRGRSRSIYHIVEKDESDDEEIKTEQSSEKVSALDGKFFEQFRALGFSDGKALQETYEPIQDTSVNNNAVPDFTQCMGLYKDIPRPTHKETEFFYCAALTAIKQRLGIPHEMKELPNDRLFEYIQETLSVKPNEHVSLLDQVNNEMPPPLILVADVVSAKGLLAKDANGFSDPFCILGIVPMWKEHKEAGGVASGGKGVAPRKRHDVLMDHSSSDCLSFTHIEEKTLNPKWDEQFRFDVGDLNNEQLQVEVWDHDEDSSVLHTMKNVKEVSSIKGMGRFFKEVAQSAKKDGKNLDDFLGWVTIPLNTISSKGMECFFPLQSRTAKSKVEGEVKLKLQLALKKDTPKASAETIGVVHQHLWYSFAHHEVCDKGMSECRWSGELSPAPKAILHQLSQQHQLPEIYQLASQWIAYCQRCVLPHLDFNVMLSIITALANLLKKNERLDQQTLSYIKKSCQEFIDYSIRMLQKQHEAFPSRNTDAILQLHVLIRCLLIIEELSNKCKWNIYSKSVKDILSEAIKQSAKDWCTKQHILCEEAHEAQSRNLSGSESLGGDEVDGEEEETEESRRIKILVSLIEHMIHHIKVQIRPPALIYRKTLELDLPVLVHSEMANKVMEESKAMMANTRKLSRHDDHQMAIAFFSLYLAIKSFHQAGDREYRGLIETSKFHLVFKKSVEQWFDLATNKAMARIEKAVEVDEVRLVDSMVKHSSSAVDVTTTFAQIKDFWVKLDWPEAAGAYVFVAKVTDDIRTGAVEYANIVHKKLAQNHFYDDQGQFDVTDQLCIAINNIEQVRRYLSNLPTQLDYERVLDGVLMEHGSVGEEQCRQTLLTMLASTDDDMLNVIGRVVKHVGEKMEIDLRKYTTPLMGAPPDTELDEVITPLMEYLDSNLITLHSCLLKANFQRVLEELWLVVMKILKEMVNSGFRKLNQNPPIGQRMHDAFDVIGNFFFAEGKGLPTDVIQCPAFKEAMSKLSKFGMTTKRLIEDYLMARVMQQEAENGKAEAPLGILTFKVNYTKSQQKLRVRIMNATQIRPMDKDGLSDPYVIVHLRPHHVFPDTPCQKTQVVKKTLHPLFDETLEFKIPQSQVQAYGATIHFILMDHDFLAHDFGGEGYVAVSEVPGVHGKLDKNLAEEKASSIKLLPAVNKADEAWSYVQTLKERTSDKVAAEFLKKQKIKH